MADAGAATKVMTQRIAGSNHPILLTTRDALPSETRNALKTYADGGDKPVLIAGGTAAVSTAVEDEAGAAATT